MNWKKLNKKKVALSFILLLIVFALLIYVIFCFVSYEHQVKVEKEKETVEKTEKKKDDQSVNLTISFAGDFTLGNYAGQAYDGSFNQEYVKQDQDASYFLKNVKDIFENDDLTVVNLEGPLTTASHHVEKTFPFSGLPEYTNILNSGSVEVVSLANNHSEDYYEAGMNDTKQNLDQAKIGYFGYETSYTTTIKGIKIGFLGYRSMSMTMLNDEGKATIKNAIDDLKEKQNCQLVFVYYHWGIEGEYQANQDQRELAHYTIDSGADAIIGSHPHVIQGTETYNDKPIVYSLGNFCFGGNRNPSDTDSMIYQLTYNFTNNQETSHNVNIIPCQVTSVKGKNNFQPIVAEGTESQRILDKITKYSYEN